MPRPSDAAVGGPDGGIIPDPNGGGIGGPPGMLTLWSEALVGGGLMPAIGPAVGGNIENPIKNIPQLR